LFAAILEKLKEIRKKGNKAEQDDDDDDEDDDDDDDDDDDEDEDEDDDGTVFKFIISLFKNDLKFDLKFKRYFFFMIHH
jgi:hypothetical protein